MKATEQSTFSVSEYHRFSELRTRIANNLPFAIVVNKTMRNFDAIERMIDVRISGQDQRNPMRAIRDLFHAGFNFILLSIAFAQDDYIATKSATENDVIVSFVAK